VKRLYFCERAHQYYTPRRSIIRVWKTRTFEECACNCCDAYGKIVGDPDYNPNIPEWHWYTLEEPKEQTHDRP
jgi:hypothetical protein